ncbi:hypothetical protein P691DRAFT_303383 [Macrolepiota fuliginosa MF-IS2]|uniref:G domain-containing protein n=1 Tax=Macrolepiota fuliginosa MF-IS2 TaxID=1400762 RepID=A0A9P5X735_9AGAR|nr:hypothetical protein P691DRAFT_303383 [Macrolepiota fuliginosa MF-IS2]
MSSTFTTSSGFASLKTHSGKISIAVLGPTGSGKSSFIARATGKRVKTGSTTSLSHCTKKVSSYKMRLGSGQEVVLYDTPGYDLEGESPEQVLDLLRQRQNTLWSCLSKRAGIALDLVFIFHRVGDGNRIPQQTRRYLETFDRAYRESGVGGRVHVVATPGDGFNENRWQEFESAMRTELMGALAEPQLRVHQFNFTPESAKKIIVDSLAPSVMPGYALPIPPYLAAIGGQENEQPSA